LYEERVSILSRILKEAIFGDMDLYTPFADSDQCDVARQGQGKRKALRESRERNLLMNSGGQKTTLSSKLL
jgi:hypothetical protein